VVPAGISAARSATAWACCAPAIAVRRARPIAPATRRATLLSALPSFTFSFGRPATPAVITGIMAMPIPAARTQVHSTTSPWVMSGLMPQSR
jgi:hypothetical protein